MLDPKDKKEMVATFNALIEDQKLSLNETDTPSNNHISVVFQDIVL